MPKNQAPRNPAARAPPRPATDDGAPRSSPRAGAAPAALPENVPRSADPEGPVVKNERMGPDGEAEVMGHRLELGQDVGRGAHRHPEAGRAPAVATRARHEPGQRQPGGGQARVVPAPPPRAPAPESAGNDRPVVKENHEGRGDHHLLRRHAEEAGEPREPQPEAPGSRLRSLHPADEGVERQEIAEAHQGLRPLHDVADGLGLQRMNGPEEGDRQGQRQRLRAPLRECPACDPKEKEPGQEVNRHVHRVIAPHLVAAEGVVHGQGELQERAAADCQSAGGWARDQGRPGRQVPDRGIVRDRGQVVVEHRAGEAPGVGRESADDDRRRREEDQRPVVPAFAFGRHGPSGIVREPPARRRGGRADPHRSASVSAPPRIARPRPPAGA